MENYPRYPSEVHEGRLVRIEVGKEKFEGKVVKVITKQHNFRGIRVEIDSGKVGRIKSFLPETTSKEYLLRKKFREEQNLEEGQTLEFKASFLFDLNRYEHDGTTAIHYNNPHSVAKTIAAFANSNGGTLYIGISNKDKKILGLESDYNILKRYQNRVYEIKNNKGGIIKLKSNGEFQTSLRGVMEQLFVDKFDYSENTAVDIFKVEGKDLCVINVNSSKTPVILHNKNKYKYEFYVRHTDQSEPYDDIVRFCNYWCEHICKLPS